MGQVYRHKANLISQTEWIFWQICFSINASSAGFFSVTDTTTTVTAWSNVDSHCFTDYLIVSIYLKLLMIIGQHSTKAVSFKVTSVTSYDCAFYCLFCSRNQGLIFGKMKHCASQALWLLSFRRYRTNFLKWILLALQLGKLQVTLVWCF